MATEKRLIDANALGRDAFHITQLGKGIRCVVDWDDIEAAPTVDAVEVVHGQWEWLWPNRLAPECMCGTCSVCKVRSKYIVNTDICPNCGAKMDVKKEAEGKC